MNIKKILGRAVLVAGLVTATAVPQIGGLPGRFGDGSEFSQN